MWYGFFFMMHVTCHVFFFPSYGTNIKFSNCWYRFMIYIKEGVYFENVDISKKKTMIMLVGDGIGKTIIKANRSRVDGWSTFQSATVG